MYYTYIFFTKKRNNNMKTFTVIAEIGCCHIGNLERAKNLAKLAKLSGADVLKTQKRNPYKSIKEK